MAVAPGDEGTRIVLLDVDETALNATASEMRRREAEVYGMHCDLHDLGALNRAYQDSGNAFGPIGILINDPAVSEIRPFPQMNTGVLQDAIDT